MKLVRKLAKWFFKDLAINVISNLILGIIIVLFGFLLILAGNHFWHPLVIVGGLFIVIGLFIAAII